MFNEEIKIRNQRIELNRLNKRCQELSLKLNVVYRLDFIKSRLSMLDDQVAFKSIIANPLYREELENIFSAPFESCMSEYEYLLRARNDIVHRYTKETWNNKKRRYWDFLRKKSLTELEESWY